MIAAYCQMHRAGKYSQHGSIIWPFWLNGWVFVCGLDHVALESRWFQANFRYRLCFEQGVLNIQATVAWILTLNCVRDMIITCQMHRTDKYSVQTMHNTAQWLMWLYWSDVIYVFTMKQMNLILKLF